MVGLIENQNIMTNFPINSRIKVYSDIGTVKYVGEVLGYQGVWVGVEWDDPERGKHNGVVNGVQYFVTSHPTSGSMIRPAKILSPETLAEAIERKYILDCENVLDEKLMKEAQEYLRASIFEIVGMEKIIDKQSRLENLVDISAAHSLTAAAGNLSSLTTLVQIDLTSTLIWNWNIVADIVKQLPSLRFLNLAQNKIHRPSIDEIENLEPYFRHLKNLSLRHCGLSNWDDILYIARLWPNIEELGLQDNNISEISVDTTSENLEVLQNLEALDLHMNKLENFDEILKLGKLKKLNKLLLMENGIQRINLPQCNSDQFVNIFKTLTTINLRDNPIADELQEFNELDKLPALEELSQTPNQLSGGYEDMFSRAVAMISNLRVLNKTEIINEQRRGAEYDIWKMFGADWLKTEDNQIERLKLVKKCRAYPRLVKKYGLPEESMVNPAVKKSALITINIMDSNTNRIITKKVPVRLSLQTLQGLIIKLFKTDSLELPRISYIDANHKNLKVEMDNLSKNLDYYSIQDGDTVIFE